MLAETAFRPRYRLGVVGAWVRLAEILLGTDLGRVRLEGGTVARALARLCGAQAVTLGSRVVFAREAWRDLQAGRDRGLALVFHELAHVAQIRRLGRFGLARFLGRYLGEYLAGRVRGLNHGAAYRAISFEREAHALEARALCWIEAGVLTPAVGRGSAAVRPGGEGRQS